MKIQCSVAQENTHNVSCSCVELLYIGAMMMIYIVRAMVIDE